MNQLKDNFKVYVSIFIEKNVLCKNMLNYINL